MSAIFSDCRNYRFRLDRDLGRDGPTVAVLGVNPSTADEVLNDSTVRKDIGFGERHGWGRLIKGNKFGWRSTEIDGLREIEDPVGAANDAHIEQILRDADIHVVAWGRLNKLPMRLRRRWREVRAIADRVGCSLLCFGTTMDGQPIHTGRIGYDRPLVSWTPPR